MTRSFCYWPDFVPEPETLDTEVLDRFRDFLDAHVELGLGTIPTFIVGHMSGENWDPAWRQGRDLYRDVWLVSQQAWFAGEIARRFGDASRRRRLARLERDAALRRQRRRARRSRPGRGSSSRRFGPAGATQPISLGDGAWGVEVSGVDNGYSLRDLAPLVDFVGPHVYPMQDDQLRQFLTAAFVCELCGDFGKPVVLEEFGVSSDFAADDHAAAYYRQVLLHDAARRRARLDRVEQLRLRRPPRAGSLPPPRLRAPLRPHRPRRPAEAAADGARASSRSCSARLVGARLGRP